MTSIVTAERRQSESAFTDVNGDPANSFSNVTKNDASYDKTANIDLGTFLLVIVVSTSYVRL